MRKILDFFERFEEIDEKKVFWTAFWISVIVMVLHILFFHKVERDSAFLYTRMAREFGEGRYQYAFWPTCPPLLSVLAGCFVKIGFTAFGAVKSVSAFAFIIGLFPFRALVKRITNDKVAAWACLVYVCSSYPLRYSVYGYPFALKMFFMILSVLLVVKFAESLKMKYTMYLGLSLGFLALSRGEGVVYVPFYVFWMIVLPIYYAYRKREKIKPIIRKELFGILAVIIFFLIVSWPQMYNVYKYTGVPVTEYRIGEIIKKVIDSAVIPDSALNIEKNMNLENGMTNVNENSNIVLKPNISDDDPYRGMNGYLRSFLEALQGLYPVLIFFALVGFFIKIKRREFYVLDLLFISLILYNIAVLIDTSGITRRYTAVTQPFEFGWVVLGGYYIYSCYKWKFISSQFKKYWRFLIGVTISVILIIMLINGCKNLTDYLKKGNQYLTAGEWIKENKQLFPSTKTIKFLPNEFFNSYCTKRLPVIASVIGEYAYWAEGDTYLILPTYIYPYKYFVNLLDEHNATVLVFDDRVEGICPTFLENYKKDFTEVKVLKKWDVRIFKRNVRGK
jgi:hypothetical protein